MSPLFSWAMASASSMQTSLSIRRDVSINNILSYMKRLGYKGVRGLGVFIHFENRWNSSFLKWRLSPFCWRLLHRMKSPLWKRLSHIDLLRRNLGFRLGIGLQ